MNEDFAIENGILTKYRGSGENVIVPGGVTSIGDGAFDGCSALESITLPESLTFIGAAAFHGCGSLRLRAFAGSYAEEYASNNGIPCETTVQ